MRLKLIVSCLALVACGDNLEPNASDVSAGSEEDTPPDDTEPRPIEASIYIEAPSCTEALARYEMSALYLDDRSPASNVRCRWTFDDGATSDTCAGEHVFAEGGFHDFVLEVEDLDTGATTRATQRRYIEYPLTAELEVTTPETCGLQLSWRATVFPSAFVIITVEPADKVIADDPLYRFNREYTVGVTEAGTYTVRLFAEDERSIPICTASVVKEVTVTCCPDH